MADGRTHDVHGLAAAAGALVGASLAVSLEAGVALGSGVAFGALYLSPDLDLNYSRPARRWGPLRCYWWPYAKAFSHRGLSHHPFYGFLSRLIWAAPLLATVAYVTRGSYDVVCPEFAGFLLGCWAGNLVHLIGDA